MSGCKLLNAGEKKTIYTHTYSSHRNNEDADLIAYNMLVSGSQHISELIASCVVYSVRVFIFVPCPHHTKHLITIIVVDVVGVCFFFLLCCVRWFVVVSATNSTWAHKSWLNQGSYVWI